MSLVERHTERWRSRSGPCPDDPVVERTATDWAAVARDLRAIIDDARDRGDVPADPDCAECQETPGRVGEQGPEGQAINVPCPRCFPATPEAGRNRPQEAGEP